jgi:hypothetical protein
MTSIIPGYNYEVFISYRLENEGEKGGRGEEEIEAA